MTTPRVTVPVDDWKHVIGALKNAQARLGPGAAVCNVSAALAKVEHLSAAPAPEGGAVSETELRDAIALILPMAKGYAAAHPVGSNQSYVDYVENLITTREEAPAEAGEIDLYDDKVQAGIAWTMRQWGEALGLKTWTQGDGSESVEGDVGAEIHTILVDAGLRDPETNEMAALRAQPPAREDAQPVAWSLDFGMGVNAQTTFSTEGKAEHYAKDCPKPSPSVVPLYTSPPAPEAEKLRVAVEALEKIKAVRVCKESANIWTGADACRKIATEAIAALQAEQKGGAA